MNKDEAFYVRVQYKTRMACVFIKPADIAMSLGCFVFGIIVTISYRVDLNGVKSWDST